MNSFIGKANQIPKGITNVYSDGLLRLFSIPAGNWVVLPSNSFGGKPTPPYRIN